MRVILCVCVCVCVRATCWDASVWVSAPKTHLHARACAVSHVSQRPCLTCISRTGMCEFSKCVFERARVCVCVCVRHESVVVKRQSESKVNRAH